MVSKLDKEIVVRLKLVSFELCPFVHKVNILLHKKRIDCDILYIDLANPPEWFIQESPHGKVPILITPQGVLFESNAISEYLEEQYPPKFHPSDAFTRAQNRAWIQSSDTLAWCSYYLTIRKTEQEFIQVVSEINKELNKLEAQLTQNKFFNSSEFSLVDASYAPVFYRFYLIMKFKSDLIDWHKYPKVAIWYNNLLSDTEVLASVVEDIEEKFNLSVKTRQGYLARYLTRQPAASCLID